MNKIDKVSKILNEFFNEKAEAKAVEKKFIKRYRKMKGSEVPPKRQTKNESKRETISYYNCVTF